MASELEWKYAVPDDDRLGEILNWVIRNIPEAGPAERFRMRTTYYDAPDRRFARANMTLRRRMENGRSVLCVKAPAQDVAGAPGAKQRGEWEHEGTDLPAALPEFVAQGAPKILLEAADCGLEPVCGAEFERTAIPLSFPDGSRSELAFDSGRLLGEKRTCPLCEMELERKAGAVSASLRLLEQLVRRFDLLPEPMSKYARAKRLG